jgi:hypothetical protein
MGFMAQRQEQSNFNFFIIKHNLSLEHLKEEQARKLRDYNIRKQEEDWEYESAFCPKGPICFCHAIKPKFH